MSQTVAERRAQLYAEYPALAEMAKTSESWASLGQQVVERLLGAGVGQSEIVTVLGYVWQAKNMEDEALVPKVTNAVLTPDGQVWEYHRAGGWQYMRTATTPAEADIPYGHHLSWRRSES